MKKLNIICFIFAICFFSVNRVFAGFPSNLSNITQSLSSFQESGAGFGTNVKASTSLAGVPIICTDHYAPTPVGSSCTLIDSESGDGWSKKIRAGVAAIINESKSAFSTSEVTPEFLSATIAINSFLGDKGIEMTNKNITSGAISAMESQYKVLVNRYLELANDAYNNYATATLSLSTKTLTFTKSGDNYVSNAISVTTNGSYNVTTNKGTVNKNGNSFTITVPLSEVTLGSTTNISVSVTASKTNYEARNYNCGSGVQTVTPSLTVEVSSTASDRAEGSISRTKLTIKKTDSDSKLIEGAKIRIESTDKSYIREFESSTTERIIEDLPYGEYNITEVKAPEGYVRDISTIKITLSSSKLSAEATLVNRKTQVEISKIDSKTKQIILGATLQLQDADGKKIEEWTTGIEPHIIKGLNYGTYYLVEIKAPDGYAINKNKEKIVLDENNVSIKKSLENTKTKVEISKIDSETGKFISGVKLQVQDENGKSIEELISNGDLHVIEGLKYGTYYLVEINALSGYALNKNKVKFVLDNNTSSIKVEMKNKKNVVEISKISIVNGKLLPGASLQIEDKDGNIVKFCTDEKGNKNVECKWISTDKKFVINGMPYGTYYLVEVNAPEGYVLNTEKVKFDVNQDLEIVKVEMRNGLEVEVPDTLSSSSVLLLTIAMLDIFIGIGVIVYIKKYRTNNN